MKILSRGLRAAFRRIANIRNGSWTSKAVTADMQEYRSQLVDAVFDTYATRHSKTYFKLLIRTKRATKLHRIATLRVLYEPHPLSEFQVLQVAITFHNARKRVTSRKKGLGFAQTGASGKRQYTKVRVRKAGAMKLIHGKLGYKGFLQSGNRQIFERKQQRTWIGHERAPIQRLFGPSFSQMAGSREVQKKMLPWASDYHVYKFEMKDL